MKNLSFFEKINRIYFIGIGGISLSAIASIVKSYGFIVSGSDLVKSDITKRLEENNIKINYKQVKKNIKIFNPDLVVYSGAICENNKEIISAKELNIKLLERCDFIKEILLFYKNVISISGTHGKSTTTAMISEIFFNAGLNPTIHIGAESINLNSNFIVGDNNFFINEACEYRKSFLKFKSSVGVVLNVEEDHPDCYKSLEDIENAFSNFCEICDTVVINSNYNKIVKDNKKIINFNLYNASFCAKNLRKLSSGGYSFRVFKNNNDLGQFRLNIFGKHNIFNALASIAVADYYKVNVNIIKDSLRNFKGIKRRFEKFETSKFCSDVYFDYAHHPTEIKKLIEEVNFFNKPLILVFQPHTYSRTQKYFEDFCSSFYGVYQTVFYKTYSAREKKIKGSSAKDLYLALKYKQNVFYYNSFNKILKHLKKYAKSNNIVLFVGAGDIYNIKEKLKDKNQ